MANRIYTRSQARKSSFAGEFASPAEGIITRSGRILKNRNKVQRKIKTVTHEASVNNNNFSFNDHKLNTLHYTNNADEDDWCADVMSLDFEDYYEMEFEEPPASPLQEAHASQINEPDASQVEQPPALQIYQQQAVELEKQPMVIKEEPLWDLPEERSLFDDLRFNEDPFLSGLPHQEKEEELPDLYN